MRWEGGWDYIQFICLGEHIDPHPQPPPPREQRAKRDQGGPKGPRGLGGLWGYSEAIPNGEPLRMETYSEGIPNGQSLPNGTSFRRPFDVPLNRPLREFCLARPFKRAFPWVPLTGPQRAFKANCTTDLQSSQKGHKVLGATPPPQRIGALSPTARGFVPFKPHCTRGAGRVPRAEGGRGEETSPH